MNYDIVTISDCLEAHNKRGWGVILEAGHITGFEKTISEGENQYEECRHC